MELITDYEEFRHQFQAVFDHLDQGQSMHLDYSGLRRRSDNGALPWGCVFIAPPRNIVFVIVLCAKKETPGQKAYLFIYLLKLRSFVFRDL